jgi:hypothetical protein
MRVLLIFLLTLLTVGCGKKDEHQIAAAKLISPIESDRLSWSIEKSPLTGNCYEVAAVSQIHFAMSPVPCPASIKN